MTIQLIGAGLGRTGTMSLKLALEQLLGGTCHHMMEVFGHPEEIPSWDAAMRGGDVDFPTLLEPYCAIVDYPGAAVWRELASAFPDAPVLLSTRATSQVWWESASSTIFPSTQREPDDDDGDGEVLRAQRRMISALFERSLGGDITDADAVMAAYEAHNAAVRAEIAPERLFEYQPGDGWGPICAALGLPEPSEPFPHTNTREEFRSRAGLD
jgi:Sulfotransferase domain